MQLVRHDHYEIIPNPTILIIINELLIPSVIEPQEMKKKTISSQCIFFFRISKQKTIFIETVNETFLEVHSQKKVQPIQHHIFPKKKKHFDQFVRTIS